MTIAYLAIGYQNKAQRRANRFADFTVHVCAEVKTFRFNSSQAVSYDDENERKEN